MKLDSCLRPICVTDWSFEHLLKFLIPSTCSSCSSWAPARTCSSYLLRAPAQAAHCEHLLKLLIVSTCLYYSPKYDLDRELYDRAWSTRPWRQWSDLPHTVSYLQTTELDVMFCHVSEMIRFAPCRHVYKQRISTKRIVTSTKLYK